MPRLIRKYACKYCLKVFDSKEDAEACEKLGKPSKPKFKTGTRFGPEGVVEVTGTSVRVFKTRSWHRHVRGYTIRPASKYGGWITEANLEKLGKFNG